VFAQAGRDHPDALDVRELRGGSACRLEPDGERLQVSELLAAEPVLPLRDEPAGLERRTLVIAAQVPVEPVLGVARHVVGWEKGVEPGAVTLPHVPLCLGLGDVHSTTLRQRGLRGAAVVEEVVAEGERRLTGPPAEQVEVVLPGDGYGAVRLGGVSGSSSTMAAL